MFIAQGYEDECDNIAKYKNNWWECSSIDEIRNTISVSPNPFTNTITIHGMSDGMRYTLYTSIGTPVLSGSNATIDTKNIPKGVYMLEVVGTEGTQVVKLIK